MLQTQTLHGLISSSYEPLGALTSSKQRQHNVFWEILIKILQVSTQAQYFDCNLSPMRSKITARRALLRIAQSLQPWRDCLALLYASTWKNSCGPVAGWLARRGMAARAHSLLMCHHYITTAHNADQRRALLLPTKSIPWTRMSYSDQLLSVTCLAFVRMQSTSRPASVKGNTIQVQSQLAALGRQRSRLMWSTHTP